MNSLRLKTIASFISKKDKVVDIGCDHAYLAIYLIKKQLCQKVIAADVNQNALNNARKNIQKEGLSQKIPTVLSDGLEKIDQQEINTIVLAGMGTSTILKILSKMEKEVIEKLIIQTNNDCYLLRKSINELGYFLEEEKTIYEKGHFYIIGKYKKGKKNLKPQELYFGLFDEKNRDYYNFLNNELRTLYLKISWKHFKKKIKLAYKLRVLKKYL